MGDRGCTLSQACPICRKPMATATRPFCSPRCASIDLGRWLSEAYVVPGADGEAMDTALPDPRLDRPDTLG